MLAAAAAASLAPAQALPVAPVSPDVVYRVIDLGTVASSSSVCRCFFGTALSNRGHAVGRFFGTNGRYAAFLWQGGGMVDIGSLGGGVTQVLAVNDAGVAAGLSENVTGGSHAFVYRGGVMRDLGTLGGTHSEARSINDGGVVAGSAQTGGRDEHTHAAIWVDGRVLDLGTLGGEFSEGHAINAAGHVVGWAWDGARNRRAFLWTPATGMLDLGDFGPDDAAARAINDTGLIAGSALVAHPAGTTHAFLWAHGSMRDLGVLREAGRQGPFGPELINTFATGVNDAGQVVGNSYPGSLEPPLRPGPFLWQGGAMTNLNDLIERGSGWVITEANGINDRGQIVGTARSPTGQVRAVVLEPSRQ
jgi:probable HAF family extracellular repeat protein